MNAQFSREQLELFRISIHCQLILRVTNLWLCLLWKICCEKSAIEALTFLFLEIVTFLPNLFIGSKQIRCHYLANQIFFTFVDEKSTSKSKLRQKIVYSSRLTWGIDLSQSLIKSTHWFNQNKIFFFLKFLHFACVIFHAVYLKYNDL